MKESHKIPHGPSLVWRTVLALPSEQGEVWGLHALQNNSTHIPHGLVRAQQWPGGRRRGMKHSRVKARCRGGTEGSSVVGVVVAGAKSSRVVCCLSSVSCTSAQEQRVYSSSEGSLGTSPLLTLQWVQQNVNSLLLPPCFGVAGEALKVSAGKGLLQKPFFFPKIIPPSSCPKQTVLGAWRHCWAVQQEQSWPLRCVDAPCFSAFGFCQCPCA